MPPREPSGPNQHLAREDQEGCQALQSSWAAPVPGPLGCVMSPGLLAPSCGHHLPGACVGDHMGSGEVSPLPSEDGLQALLFQPLQGRPSAEGAPFSSAL